MTISLKKHILQTYLKQMFVCAFKGDVFLNDDLKGSFVQMYCANCGAKISGFKCADGAFRMSCPRCRVKIFSRQKNLGEVNIKLKSTN